MAGLAGCAGDGDISIDVAFGTVSDYLDVPAGERQVEITASHHPSASVFDGTATVEADTDYTLAAAGELSRWSGRAFGVLGLEDDNSAVEDRKARLRTVHASPDAPAVDVTAAGGDVTLFDGVEYTDSEYTTLEAGDYTVEVRTDTETDDGDVVADFDASLGGGTVYTVFAAGYLTPEHEPAHVPFDLVVGQDDDG